MSDFKGKEPIFLHRGLNLIEPWYKHHCHEGKMMQYNNKINGN